MGLEQSRMRNFILSMTFKSLQGPVPNFLLRIFVLYQSC